MRGVLSGSWEGLDPDITIVPWYFEKRSQSLKFFANRANRQVIAGYYDHNPAQATEWLKAAQPYSVIEGIMYTTWEHNYKDLERFSEIARANIQR